jgi:Zn-dependent protease
VDGTGLSQSVGALLDDPIQLLGDLLLKIPALVLAVTLHEVAHGMVADRLGDPTARQQGRLTLNPLSHIDPLGALAFVLTGFGWARPVPVTAGNFRHPLRDMALVAAAGPAANFVVAFVGLVALMVVSRSALLGRLAEPIGGIFLWAFQFNLALGIFNLIPLPPLDGGHFLPFILPRGAARAVQALGQYGPILLLVLVFSGATQYVVGPLFEALVQVYMGLVRLLL